MTTPERAVSGFEAAESSTEITPLYMDALKLVERLHRRLLDVIKDEFERRGRSDVNSVQALLLFNIGDSEVTAGELRSRGYYQGSNVSYNLKKLVDMGYVNHERSKVDRRSVRISLSEKGLEIRHIVSELYERHIKHHRTGGRCVGRGLHVAKQVPAASRTLLDRSDSVSVVTGFWRGRGESRPRPRQIAALEAPVPLTHEERALL